MHRQIAVLGAMLFALGCSAPGGTDIRSLLLTEASRSCDFPDGREVRLTHFGYVGALQTDKGSIHVVDLRSVITGMPSPRGLNFIAFFDQEARYLGRVPYGLARPLWCDGGKVYLFGGIAYGEEAGNVIDLSAGFKGLRVLSESAYGSSGGIEE